MGPWGDVPCCGYCLSADGSENAIELLKCDWICIWAPFEWENWVEDLVSKSAVPSVSVLMDHWKGSIFEQVLAALYDLHWLSVALCCTQSIRTVWKTLSYMGRNLWALNTVLVFSGIVNSERALIKMVNNSLSASSFAVQIFWLHFQFHSRVLEICCCFFSDVLWTWWINAEIPVVCWVLQVLTQNDWVKILRLWGEGVIES